MAIKGDKIDRREGMKNTISRTTKIRPYKCLIRTVLVYAAETMILTKKKMKGK